MDELYVTFHPRKASFAFFSHPFTFLQTKFKTVNHLFQNHDIDQTLVIMQFFKENIFYLTMLFQDKKTLQQK